MKKMKKQFKPLATSMQKNALPAKQLKQVKGGSLKPGRGKIIKAGGDTK